MKELLQNEYLTIIAGFTAAILLLYILRKESFGIIGKILKGIIVGTLFSIMFYFLFGFSLMWISIIGISSFLYILFFAKIKQ